MGLSLSQMRSAKRFAIEMSLKLSKDIKDKQRYMILALNQYCKGLMSAEEYFRHIKAYNKILLAYDYWKSNAIFLSQEINAVSGCQHG